MRGGAGRLTFVHSFLFVMLSALAWLGGCVPPPSPLERLTDAAYDLNTATRFGRFDVAMGYVEPGQRTDFARRHAKWGRGLRVLDVDLLSIQPVAEDAVEVHVMVAWHRVDESTMRQSQVAQLWKIEEDDWRLVAERRIAGDAGLFVPGLKKKPALPQQSASDESAGGSAG